MGARKWQHHKNKVDAAADCAPSTPIITTAAKVEMLHPPQVRERNPLPGRMRLLSLPGATQMVSAPNLNTALLSFSSPKHRCIRLATTPIARTR